ncbi:MAG: phage tail assembly protein [Treponema sp.]|jgi:hypothetical protein|nr:phage tail assembly protein [Treponema sp.]
MIDPFASETVELYAPVTVGEHRVTQLLFNPPVVKDLLQAGTRYPEGTIPFTACLISSLTGEPETVIHRLVPEDWANAVLVADRTYQRFCGRINLFKQNGERPENPTTAATPPPSSSGTSAA